MSKRAKVPGLPAQRSYKIPLCRIHGIKARKNDAGHWYCPECFETFAAAYLEGQIRGHSAGGVDLPVGVEDDRIEIPKVTPLQPNRAMRRAMGIR